MPIQLLPVELPTPAVPADDTHPDLYTFEQLQTAVDAALVAVPVVDVKVPVFTAKLGPLEAWLVTDDDMRYPDALEAWSGGKVGPRTVLPSMRSVVLEGVRQAFAGAYVVSCPDGSFQPVPAAAFTALFDPIDVSVDVVPVGVP